MKKVFIWSLIVSLGGFLFGFDTAVISGVEKSIQDLFMLNPFWHGITISSALIGTLIGALFAGRPADKYGRKKLLFLIAGLFFFSAIGSAVVSQLSLFILFRFIGGVAVGASSVVGPMYISEISPAQVRGKMTSLFQFNVIFGILIAYISNYLLKEVGDEPWRFMLGIEAVPAFIFFVLLFFIPESPRFLVKSNLLIEAELILQKISKSNIKAQIHSIKKVVDDGNQEDSRLFSRNYTYPISIAFLVAMFNQLSGINAILYYAPRIFELSGLSSETSMYQPVLIGITNGLFTVLGMLMIDKVGRKKLLIIGSAGMAVCLGIISKTLYFEDFGGYGILIYLLMYIMFFGFSTGTVIWVLISEVFPTRVRGKGQSFGSLTHWFFATVITFIFPIAAQTTEGGGYAFAFFSFMMVIQVITVWKYFPETKGITLEELGGKLSSENN